MGGEEDGSLLSAAGEDFPEMSAVLWIEAGGWLIHEYDSRVAD
jgi:hypothetical protein